MVRLIKFLDNMLIVEASIKDFKNGWRQYHISSEGFRILDKLNEISFTTLPNFSAIRCQRRLFKTS